MDTPSPRFLSSHKSRPSLSTSYPSPAPSPPLARTQTASKKRDSIGSTSSLSSAFSNLPLYQDERDRKEYKPSRLTLLGQPPPYPFEDEDGVRAPTPTLGQEDEQEPASGGEEGGDVLTSSGTTSLEEEVELEEEEGGEEDYLDDLIRRSSSILSTAQSILASTRSSRDYFARFNSLEDSLSLSLFDQEHSIRRQLNLSEDLEGRTEDLVLEAEGLWSVSARGREERLRKEEKERENREREEREREAKDPLSLLRGDSRRKVGALGGAGSAGLGKGPPPRVQTLHLNSEDADTLFDLASSSSPSTSKPRPRPSPAVSSGSTSYFGSSADRLSSLLQQPDPSSSTSSPSPSPAHNRRSSTSAISLLSSLQQPSSTPPSMDRRRASLAPSFSTSSATTLSSTPTSAILSPQFSSSSYGFSTITEAEDTEDSTTPSKALSDATSPTTPPSSRPSSPCPQTPTTPRHTHTRSTIPPSPTTSHYSTTATAERDRLRRVSVTSLPRVSNITEDRTNAVAFSHKRNESGLKERLEAMRGEGGGGKKGEEEGKGGWWWSK